MAQRLRRIALRLAALALLSLAAATGCSPAAQETPGPRLKREFAPVSLRTVDRPPRAGATNLPIRAGQFVPFVCEVAFDGLAFFDPVFIAPLPDGSGRFVVVERRGTVQLVSRGEERFERRPLLDITDRVHMTPHQAEEGLLGLAFHPRFADANSPHGGEFFVYYVANGAVANGAVANGAAANGAVANGATPGASTNRLSRFRMKAGRLDEVDHDSETILIDQLQQDQAHNGGGLLFGPDGFLYLSLGDDARSPPNPNAQTISNNLFSGILRLDVDRQGGRVSHPPPRGPRDGRTAEYFIPNDNPFVGRDDVLEEFYVLGFRNPWRFSFDRATGLLYSSDVGGRRREEINLVEAGHNYGWNYAEGTLLSHEMDPPGEQRPANVIGVQTWPLFEYSRDAAHRCVIGGYVYRGRQFPELVGRYVYADQSGRIYALDLEENGRKAGANRLIAVLPEAGIGISSLGEDEQGELYFCAIGELASETGRVFRLRRVRPDERDFVPEELSETGLFIDWANLTPSPGVVAFDVKVPLWSDGAAKRRWIALPPDARVEVDAQGQLQFPPGTVLVKHFDLPIDPASPSPPRPLETRVLVCDDRGGVYGATYRWSSDGRRARLVTFNETESIALAGHDGTNGTQAWAYPGRFECALCHHEGSDRVLGFNLRQLDRPIAADGGGEEDQITRLIRLGVLSPAAAKVPEASIGRLVTLDDTSATLEHRVRSYLDVNCSNCHNPRTRFAAFDARIARDIGEQGLVDGTSHYHHDRGPDVRIVRPGDVAQSMLHYRMAAADPCLRMPPLGTSVVDERAVEVVAAWIRSLPPDATPATLSSRKSSGAAASEVAAPK